LLINMPFIITEVMCLKMFKYGIFVVLAVLALVSVASAALPSQVTGYVNNPGGTGWPATGSYFDVMVTADGSLELQNGLHRDAWCVDTNANPANYITPGTSYVFDVTSSLDDPQFAYLPHTIQWKKINYVLNNHATWSLTSSQIQDVIWNYDGAPLSSPGGNIGAAITATDSFFAGGANADWTPPCDGVYAVLLNAREPTNANYHIQLIFVELPTTTCSIPSPEFPTLALPAAMIVGMVGVVYTLRTREK
jgi:hypothetical protein